MAEAPAIEQLLDIDLVRLEPGRLELSDLYNEIQQLVREKNQMQETITHLANQVKEEREESRQQVRNLTLENRELRESINVTSPTTSNTQVEFNPGTVSTPARQTPRNVTLPSHVTLPMGAVWAPNPKLSCQDIEKLGMKDLHGVQTEALIRMFIRQVKQLGGSEDDGGKLIAFNRMDRELRLFVDGELQRLSGGGTLADVEDVLLTQFSRPQSAVEAYRELCNQGYSMEDEPRQFVNKFRANFRAIGRAFPHDKSPKEELMWKRVIMRGLPEPTKDRLSVCAGEGMEDAFLSELETERSFRRVPINRVVDRPERRIENRIWACGWCQDGSRHLRRDCPRQPPLRSCFDCLAVGERKGHAGCPGRPPNSSGNGRM